MQIQPNFYEYKVKGYDFYGRKSLNPELSSDLVADYLNKRVIVSLSGDWIKCSHFRLTFEGEELYNCYSHSVKEFDSTYYIFVLEELEKQGSIKRKQDIKIEGIRKRPKIWS